MEEAWPRFLWRKRTGIREGARAGKYRASPGGGGGGGGEGGRAQQDASGWLNSEYTGVEKLGGSDELIICE